MDKKVKSASNNVKSKELQPGTLAMLEYMEANDVPLTLFTDSLYEIIEPSSNKTAYYQRLLRITKGDSKSLTEQETKAIYQLIDILSNPATYVKAFHKAGNLNKKLSYLKQSYTNKSTVDTIHRTLKGIAELSIYND